MSVTMKKGTACLTFGGAVSSLSIGLALSARAARAPPPPAGLKACRYRNESALRISASDRRQVQHHHVTATPQIRDPFGDQRPAPLVHDAGADRLADISKRGHHAATGQLAAPLVVV